MSPILFQLYLDILLKECKKKCEKIDIKLTDNICLFNLLFADAQVIIAKEGKDIDYMKKLLETYEIWDLNINFGKTECLTSSYKKDLIIE